MLTLLLPFLPQGTEYEYEMYDAEYANMPEAASYESGGGGDYINMLQVPGILFNCRFSSFVSFHTRHYKSTLFSLFLFTYLDFEAYVDFETFLYFETYLEIFNFVTSPSLSNLFMQEYTDNLEAVLADIDPETLENMLPDIINSKVTGKAGHMPLPPSEPPPHP